MNRVLELEAGVTPLRDKLASVQFPDRATDTLSPYLLYHLRRSACVTEALDHFVLSTGFSLGPDLYVYTCWLVPRGSTSGSSRTGVYTWLWCGGVRGTVAPFLRLRGAACDIVSNICREAVGGASESAVEETETSTEG